MCEGLKQSFGVDYPIVASKFYMQKANLCFIQGRLEEAKTACARGLELVKQVNTKDADIKNASHHTYRDILNLLVRTRAKLEKGDSAVIRKQLADEHGLPITFNAGQDEQKAKINAIHQELIRDKEARDAQKEAEVEEAQDEEQDEEAVTWKAGVIFGLVMTGVTALSYQVLKQKV